MRQVLDNQTYMDFSEEASLKIVREYRAKYEWISKCLDANPTILDFVHEDLETLSTSATGRQGTYTSENLFRAMLVHQIERTALRETIIRIAESPMLQAFIRLGNRPVMDFTFLGRAIKAIDAVTWKRINEVLAQYAIKKQELDVSQIRVDSTVIEANIHYPTDSSLLWDSYRVMVRILRDLREYGPEFCPYRFHDKKTKKDLVYIHRYMRSRSKGRQREMKRRYQRLHESVVRVHGISKSLIDKLKQGSDLLLRGFGLELEHYCPIIEKVCNVAERAALKGETVPARERVFSIFEEHTELIKRGKSGKNVEFGHAIWLAQNKSKFITDYEVMGKKEADTELLEEITRRHRLTYEKYPKVVAADTGFRAIPQTMAEIEKHVEEVAVPGRGKNRQEIETHLHHFRAGIEGTISVLKRAFRLSICMYRGFKSFASSIGMAIFCHNILKLAPG